MIDSCASVCVCVDKHLFVYIHESQSPVMIVF